ncbi:MAG: hypothetical protein Pg6C_17090 [Treponemataceae bacterium]|nr:MAG: hypothetical protein Pg6C_17090 [Treponemataceae bacterium]
MKAVDAIDSAAKAEELTQAEREDYFTKMIMGKDVVEEVKTGRGAFTVKYPKPKDILAIGRVAAFRRDYKPAGAFDGQTEMYNVMASTLDVVVVSGPEWYEAAKKANKNFTFLEVPSREFISELYGKAYSFREQVDQRLETEAGADDRAIPAAAGADEAVDGGAFGGLSSQ